MQITQDELDKLVREAVLVALSGGRKRAIERVFRKAGVGSESADRAEQVLTLAASVHRDVERLPALLTSVFGLRKSVANQLIDEARRQIVEDRDTSTILAELTRRSAEPDAIRAAVLVLNQAMRPTVRAPSQRLKTTGAIVLALGLGVWGVSALVEQPLGLIGVPVAAIGAVVLYKGIRG